jgi:SAM-dependent methyltransferase
MKVSRAERRRLEHMGLRVPASLGYSDTPVPQFLELLAAVARLSEQARGNGGGGSVRGRLGGSFYELGCGTGLLCFAAALFHDFDTIVGFELLPGLFDVCEGLHAHFELCVRGRLLRRADRALPNLKFVVGDALALKWGTSAEAPPAVVYCHSSLFGEDLMLRLSQRLAALPNDTFIITTTSPVPPSASLNGKETVRYAVRHVRRRRASH